MAAARSLAAYRKRDDANPSPLEELTEKELERLRRRTSTILLWRAAERDGVHLPSVLGTGALGSKGRVLSTETRRRIAEAVDCGIPIREIARVSGVTRQTITKYARIYRSGRPIPGTERKVSPEARDLLRDELLARPESTAPQLVEALRRRLALTVTECTVLRHVRSMGFVYDRDRGVWEPGEKSESG